MSHASVVVAIEADKRPSQETIETLVRDQMFPFDENGEWFREGSRWDWWVIGGRFSGSFTGYSPQDDPRNTETCTICDGTGIRPGGLEQFGQAWFDGCKGCNGCSGTGKSLKRYSAWVPFDGDILTRKDLDPVQFKAGYAFLRNRHWHESERMGWFGASTATECELANPDDSDVMANKCIHSDPATRAKIVVWNEPWEIWSAQFYKRFIEKLPSETILVLVDYHV